MIDDKDYWDYDFKYVMNNIDLQNLKEKLNKKNNI